MDRTEGKTIEALRREYYLPTLYQELSIKPTELDVHEKKPAPFRCRPFFYGGQWYDFASIAVMEDRGGGPEVEVHHAAQILAFVELRRRKPEVADGGIDNLQGVEECDEVGDQMLAFVKFFVSALNNNEAENPTYEGKDLSRVAKYLRLPMVHEDPNLLARYGLVDTEQIEHGLWLQHDFETPNRFWVLTKSRF